MAMRDDVLIPHKYADSAKREKRREKMNLRETKRPADWPKSGWYWYLHHDRRIEWTDNIDERWYYVCANKPEDELELRLRAMRPVVGPLPERLDRAYAEWERAVAEWNRAYAEWNRARAELNRARAEWERAVAEWNRAYAEWNRARAELNRARAEWEGYRAYVEWNRARAELNRARAEWERADAEWKRAYAEWNRARAEWNRADVECQPEIDTLAAIEVPDIPWDGKQIVFGGEK